MSASLLENVFKICPMVFSPCFHYWKHCCPIFNKEVQYYHRPVSFFCSFVVPLKCDLLGEIKNLRPVHRVTLFYMQIWNLDEDSRVRCSTAHRMQLVFSRYGLPSSLSISISRSLMVCASLLRVWTHCRGSPPRNSAQHTNRECWNWALLCRFRGCNRSPCAIRY